MKRKFYLVVISILVAMFVLSACSAAGDSSFGEPSSSGDLPPVAAVKARQAFANELGFKVEDINIVSFEQVEWTDSCLGLGGPAESCALVMVPGWEVELSAEGTSYIAHTDELGEMIRFEK